MYLFYIQLNRYTNTFVFMCAFSKTNNLFPVVSQVLHVTITGVYFFQQSKKQLLLMSNQAAILLSHTQQQQNQSLQSL